jgi:hypothetical protein
VSSCTIGQSITVAELDPQGTDFVDAIGRSHRAAPAQAASLSAELFQFQGSSSSSRRRMIGDTGQHIGRPGAGGSN